MDKQTVMVELERSAWRATQQIEESRAALEQLGRAMLEHGAGLRVGDVVSFRWGAPRGKEQRRRGRIERAHVSFDLDGGQLTYGPVVRLIDKEGRPSDRTMSVGMDRDVQREDGVPKPEPERVGHAE